MLRKTAFHLSRFSFYSLILSVFFAIALWVWIATGPRSLSFFSDYIENELSLLAPNYHVRIDSSHIGWDPLQHAIALKIESLQFLNKDGVVVMDLPESNFAFSLSSMLRGKILSPNISVIRPSIHIFTGDLTQYTENSHYFDWRSWLKKTELPLQELYVSNGLLYIDNGSNELSWRINSAHITTNFSQHGLALNGEVHVQFPSEKSTVKLNISPSEHGYTQLHLDFSHFPSYAYNDLVPTWHWPAMLEAVTNGRFGMAVYDDGTIPDIQFDIYNSHGSVNPKPWLDRSITFNGLDLRGHLYDLNNIVLQHGEIIIDDTHLTLNGTSRYTDWTSVPSDIAFNLQLNDLEPEKIANYWPATLKPKLRRWLLSAFKGGLISHVDAVYCSPFFDQATFVPEQNPQQMSTMSTALCADSSRAIIHAKDTNFTFHPAYPTLSQASGTVTVTKQDLSVDVSHAQVGSTNITKGRAYIADIWNLPIPLHVEGHVNGQLEDVMPFLSPATKRWHEKAVFSSILQARGAVSGSFSLDMPVQRKLRYDDTLLYIDAMVTGAHLSQFFKGHDVSQADLKVQLKHQQLAITGEAVMQELPISLVLDQDFSKKSLSYRLQAQTDAHWLRHNNIAEAPYISGVIGVDLTITHQGDHKKLSGSLDLTPSAIDLPFLSWDKITASPLNVTFDGMLTKNMQLQLSEFNFMGNGFSGHGSADIDLGSRLLSRFSLENARFAKNNITSLQYQRDDKTHKLRAHAKAITYSDLDLSFFGKNKHKNQELRLDIDLHSDSMSLHHNHTLSTVDLSLSCNKLCDKGHFYAAIGPDHYATANLKKQGNQVSLLMQSDHAEALIAGFNLSTYIKNGRLSIDALLNTDTKAMDGTLTLENFVTVKTPILGKILTLASFQGISDLLNNQGIKFERFIIPFYLEDNVIEIKDAETKGGSIGITSHGAIDLRTRSLDLKGTIVPAHAISSLINQITGNIPLIGDILTGNRNEGVIATKYSIEGPYKKAKVTVNPLSMLTPGILRKLFP